MRKDAQERLEEEQREYVRRQQEIADGVPHQTFSSNCMYV